MTDQASSTEVRVGVPDVGGWFRTAVTPAPRQAPLRPLGGFGRRSPAAELEAALELLISEPTLVLTGAGMSTASGLPDYRGPGAVPRHPLTYQEFVGSTLSRRRYWARSTVGWPSFRAAAPGQAHRLLAELGQHLALTGLVTQNVDGLHQRAGSRGVVELHGALRDVVCLGCGHVVDRVEMQEQLLAMNPDFAARLPQLVRDSATAPDGDAEVDRTHTFAHPDCPSCGGILKPDVVFFGENARPELVHASFAALERARVLLALGTSLTVMSGLRFVRRAARDGKRVVIVNDGDTRGDELATLRIHGRLEDVLATWAGRIR